MSYLVLRNGPCVLALLTGCAAFGAPPSVTFNRQIAPILFENCASCHRPGESGPFSLLTYADAKTHAAQIVAAVKSRLMPPWLPDPQAAKFVDERRLTERQIGLLERWVEQGAHEGDRADQPSTPQFTEGWQLGPPDLVLKLPETFTVPAEGSDLYRNFIFTFPLASKHFVRALEIRPGNKRVVHHANVLIDRNRSMRARDGRDGKPGFPGMDLKIESSAFDPESHFLFWKPGSEPEREPPGMAWTIEQGNDLILNMHLQPSGKPEPIRPVLGLYFTNDAPRLKPLLVQLEDDRELAIPAGAAKFTVTDRFTLPVDADLLAIYPHAHYLGKEIEATAELPDGSRKELIRIRNWDLNWQGVYRYQDPVALPKGSTVAMRWVFDNSAANPRNPNRPPARVTAGDRSVDEMSHLWLQLLPRGGPGDVLAIEEALLRHRIDRNPDDFTAMFNLGGVLHARGDTRAAIQELEAAVRIHPQEEVALNTLGAYLQMDGNVEQAEARYRQAIQCKPEYAEAHYNLATLLASRGAQEEAIAHLREVVRLQPRDAKAKDSLVDLLDGEAQSLAGSGKLVEAVALFREIVVLHPDSSDAFTNLGVALARQGDLPGAKQRFERALELDSENATASANLARVKSLLERDR